MGRPLGERPQWYQGWLAAGKRGGKNREHVLEIKNWDNQVLDIFEDVAFERDIFPGLQNFPITKLQKATGLSLSYCWLIRQGKVPDKRHWKNSLDLIRVTGEE
jgi:hypothetical protein